jgi:hypothetical protein
MDPDHLLVGLGLSTIRNSPLLIEPLVPVVAENEIDITGCGAAVPHCI